MRDRDKGFCKKKLKKKKVVAEFAYKDDLVIVSCVKQFGMKWNELATILPAHAPKRIRCHYMKLKKAGGRSKLLKHLKSYSSRNVRI